MRSVSVHSQAWAWAVKELTIVEINRIHEETYTQLPKYIEKLKDANPRSDITLETTIENKFQYVFVCFVLSVKGFVHCRLLLGLDGTHLKSKYQGINKSILSNCRHSSRYDRSRCK